MALNEGLREAAVDDISKIALFLFDHYARTNHETISFLYEKGILNDEAIEGALESVVLKQARLDYQAMTKSKRKFPLYADHVGSPECLAYALQNGEFTPKEIKKIPFDMGETQETFPQEYPSTNLLSNLRDRLINPREPIKMTGDYDPHPSCCCY